MALIFRRWNREECSVESQKEIVNAMATKYSSTEIRQTSGPNPSKESAQIKDIHTWDIRAEKEESAQFQERSQTYIRSSILVMLIIGAVSSFIFWSYKSSYLAPFPPPFEFVNETSTFDSLGRYVIHNFDLKKPMANFLPGLGGFWGIPMWVFYVNRGQGVCSMGVQNKDQAISKFKTAEKAYQQTPFTGFRTFVRGSREVGVDKERWEHSPFSPRRSGSEDDVSLQRHMMVGMNEMEIEEINLSHGLKTNVLYYSSINSDYPSLVRKTTFSNLHESRPLFLEVLDGLAQVLPAGLNDWEINTMGRTREAWMNVKNCVPGSCTHPFYHISQGTADTPQVQVINEGHFAVAFVEEEFKSKDMKKVKQEEFKYTPLPFIVDPGLVFGWDTSLQSAAAFFETMETGMKFDHFVRNQTQVTTSRTPCALAAAAVKIPARGSITITTVYGHAPSPEAFVNKYSPALRLAGYTELKRQLGSELVQDLTNRVDTTTSIPIFDAYVKQNYLDNVLRGGLAVPLDYGSKIFHTFSRIHGDIERDYNYFQIDPTYYSQGPGNFRDVNQNRRSDVVLSPQTESFDIRNFLSLVQSDGYNPLTVATSLFKVPPQKVDVVLVKLGITSLRQAHDMSDILSQPFRVGDLFSKMKAKGIRTSFSNDLTLTIILEDAVEDFAALYAQNGFWSDHWTYTMDLIDSYAYVFPDKMEKLLWESKPVPFFLSPAVVLPRRLRYSAVNVEGEDNNNKNSIKSNKRVLRSYSPVITALDSRFPSQRTAALTAIKSGADFVVDSTGASNSWQRSADSTVMTVSVISKLTMLAVLKFSTLDPYGLGIEMEGGKPGWNDAMNGLPGMLGSGMPETFELLRLVRFLANSLYEYQRDVQVPAEFKTFMDEVFRCVVKFNTSNQDEEASFIFWDESNNAREVYREVVVGTFSGQVANLDSMYLYDYLRRLEWKLEWGVDQAQKKYSGGNGLTPTYFYFECFDFVEKSTNMSAGTDIFTPVATTVTSFIPKRFEIRTVPSFLEGPTRQLKILKDQSDRMALFSTVKSSELYDEKLRMFTVCESLSDMGQSVGRMKAFPAGWLENQSVWLHMSYKFYLELLRGGLYDVFFAEIQTGLVPFMDAAVYGRSPLEASSFIVSSANPDPKLHGQGFLARLSGSTAEFLSMWIVMMAGHQPFRVDPTTGLPSLTLSPILPSFLFPESGVVSFTFLGTVRVTYHNPSRRDTWVLRPVTVVTVSNGFEQRYDSDTLDANVVKKIRNEEIQSIDVYYN